MQHNGFKRRLEALEDGGRRAAFPDITAALMKAYGTSEEIAAWEAAGRPATTRADFDAALERVYDEEL